MKLIQIITYLAIILLLGSFVLLYNDGVTFGGVTLAVGTALLLLFLVLQRKGSV